MVYMSRIPVDGKEAHNFAGTRQGHRREQSPGTDGELTGGQGSELECEVTLHTIESVLCWNS